MREQYTEASEPRNKRIPLWQQVAYQSRCRTEKREYERGTTLRSDYSEKLVQLIKNYYCILRIFGTILFVMSLIGLFGFIVSFLTDSQWCEGTFSMPFFRIMVFVMCVGMIGSIVFATYQLMMIYYKAVKRTENGEFLWRLGKVTYLHQYSTKRTSVTLECDGARCVPLGMNVSDFESLCIGDELIVVNLKNTIFAFNPYKIGA